MNTAKVYTMFLPCYAPQRDEILNRLHARLDDIEFVGLDELAAIMSTKGREEAYRHIAERREELDGLLVFGGYLDRELTSFGLPVVMVRSLFGVGDWDKGLLSFYKGEKLVTASLSDSDLSLDVSAARFDDLVAKVNLLVALKRAKGTKLLVVQEPEILGSYDILGMDFHVPLPHDYDRVYAQTLREIGPEVAHASLVELNEEIVGVDEAEASDVADLWIEQAEEVRETNREEILKAARLYLAMERLMEKYRADGITIRSLVPWVGGLIDVTPCLANTELNRQLRVGVCEGLVNSAITEMFAMYATGNPSFIGDILGIDRIHDTVTLAHCQCPINPYGDETVPHTIRSHALQTANEMLPADYPEAGSSLGAAVQVHLPLGEPVTALKFNLYDKTIAVSTGVSVSGDELYTSFQDILCRTKVVMKTDTELFEKKYDTARFGVHRNIVYGDHRTMLKDLAALLGFEVVEEDR